MPMDPEKAAARKSARREKNIGRRMAKRGIDTTQGKGAKRLARRVARKDKGLGPSDKRKEKLASSPKAYQKSQDRMQGNIAKRRARKGLGGDGSKIAERRMQSRYGDKPTSPAPDAGGGGTREISQEQYDRRLGRRTDRIQGRLDASGREGDAAQMAQNRMQNKFSVAPAAAAPPPPGGVQGPPPGAGPADTGVAAPPMPPGQNPFVGMDPNSMSPEQWQAMMQNPAMMGGKGMGMGRGF